MKTIREKITIGKRAYYAEYTIKARPSFSLYRDEWFLDRIPAITRAECARYPKQAGRIASERLKTLTAEHLGAVVND